MPPQRNAKGQFTKGSGGGKSGITWESDTLRPGMKKFPILLFAGIKAVMEFHEPQVESFMKTNAPWTDRTSNARNGLAAKAISSGTNFAIVCFHQMPYGPWLEVSNDGRYRVIIPTIINQGREVMISVQGLMRRLA